MAHKIYSAGSIQEAEIIKVQLERCGISVELRGADLIGSLGELPIGPETRPSLWVDEENVTSALKILDAIKEDEAHPSPEWQCPQCKETVDGRFLTCWNCGRDKV